MFVLMESWWEQAYDVGERVSAFAAHGVNLEHRWQECSVGIAESGRIDMHHAAPWLHGPKSVYCNLRT